MRYKLSSCSRSRLPSRQQDRILIIAVLPRHQDQMALLDRETGVANKAASKEVKVVMKAARKEAIITLN